MRRIKRDPYRGFSTDQLSAFVDRMVDEGTDGSLALAIGVDNVVQGRLA